MIVLLNISNPLLIITFAAILFFFIFCIFWLM